MRTNALLLALFGVSAATPPNNIAATRVDTWCVTYVSTYLRPFIDQGSLTESQEASRSASDESSFVSLDPEETPSSLDSLSSDPTSETVPTSSLVNEPDGQPVILVISAPNVEERNDKQKRAAGRFVGNNNPDTCTFASVFNLAQGQLFEGGLPVYYAAGENFKELSGQDLPASGAVTRTFAPIDGTLVFRNESLPKGEADFCQDVDGRVYVTFDGAPPGCTPVTLGVYGAALCQNGQLLGFDDLSTISSGIPTTETSDSEPYSPQTTTKTRRGTTASTNRAESVTRTSPATSSQTLKVSPGLESESSTTLEESSTVDSTFEGIDSSTSLSQSQMTSQSSSNAPVVEPTTSLTSSATSSPTGRTTSTAEDTTQVSTSTSTVTTSSTTVDACVASITTPGGNPTLEERIEDCEDLNIVTVSPYTVTETILVKRWEYQIPTGWPTPSPTNNQLAPRQADPTATTIFPNQKPTYASYCDSVEDYLDACSSVGVTATTTTLPTPTETVEEEAPACRAKNAIKRAGQYAGYEFEDDWDLIRIPGWRYL